MLSTSYTANCQAFQCQTSFFRIYCFFSSPLRFLYRMENRFRNVAENAILYVGSQHGKLDQISLILFPLSFLLFATIYWIIYLNESNRHKV